MASPPPAAATDVVKLVQSTVELPTMPVVLARLNMTLARESSSAGDVAKVLQSDPAIAANMLRIVNSAYYGLRVRVSSIPLAVSVLGFATTRRVALRAAVFTVFAQRREAIAQFDPVGFWKHSVFTGVAARALCAVAPPFADMHPEDAYMAGLLHDIGKIVLLEKRTLHYLEALRRAGAAGCPDHEAEKAVFGFTHADVGAVLALKWSLPEELTAAIRYHHAPQRDPVHRPLTSLVHVADRLAWQASLPSTVGTKPAALDESVHAAIGLAPDVVAAAMPTLLDEFADAELPW
jgi:putative nucleotidyltransferase with HDIG domain